MAKVLLKAGADAKAANKVHVVTGMFPFVLRWYDDPALASQGGVNSNQQHHLLRGCVANARRLHSMLVCCVPSNFQTGDFCFPKDRHVAPAVQF